MKQEEPKPKRGRPVTKPMPELIPDTPDNIARAVLTSPRVPPGGVAVLEEAEGLVWARWSE